MKTKLGLNKAQKSTHQSLTKPFGKKLMSFVLCICMLIGVLATMPINVSAETSGACGDNLTWTLDNNGTLTISGTGIIEDSYGWYDDEVKSIVINSGITEISNGMFSWLENLESVYLPNTLKSIGNMTFANCTSLKTINLPGGLKTIEFNAFANCTSLSTVSVPDSVTYIDTDAFSGCANIKEFIVDSSNENYCSDEGILFNKNMTTLIQYPSAKTNSEYVIPDSVTSISNSAFSGCTGLTNVIIPNSVISIGWQPFSGCSGLTSVTIPDSVTYIGDYAFYLCSGLTSINVDENNKNYCSTQGILFNKNMTTLIQYPPANVNAEYVIPDSVTYISDSAFRGCTSLTSVTIPNSVTSIGVSAFYNCSNLSKVHIFDIAAWCNIDFGNDGSNPLYYAHNLYLNDILITDLVIPDNVTSISDYAFSSCIRLTSVTIPNSVTSIGDSAFSGCSGLTSVAIPDSVTSIGWYTFRGCTGLTSINADENNKNYRSDEGILFNKNMTTLIQYPSAKTNSEYVIPNSVTSISDYAFSSCISMTSIAIPNSVTSIGSSVFSNCSGLTNVTIPDSVTSIGDFAFSDCAGLTSVAIPDSVTSIGWYTFRGCTSLTSINVDENNENYCSPQGILFNKNMTTLIQYPPANVNTEYVIPDSVTYIGDSAFSDCAGLTSVTIPNSVTSIGGSAFSGCTDLTSVTIPNSVTSIGDFAFWYCTGLTSVTIPDSVTSIGDYAFYGCSGLISVTIPNSVTDIGIYTFEYCSSLTSINVDENNKNYCSTQGILFNKNMTTLIQYPSAKTNSEYVIPNSVTSISNSAFSDCAGLTSVTIPNSVTSIGDYAFNSCTGLTSIIIPDSVTEIGDSAFSGCTGLTSVTIPDSVTSIGDYTFGSCIELTSINVDENNKNYCSTQGILFNKNMTTLIQYPSAKTNSEYIIPNSVTDIDESAFYNCARLTSVTIPNSVTSIGWHAFHLCFGLTSINVDENNKNYCSTQGILFNKNMTTLIQYPSAKTNSEYIIPNSVTDIGDHAFSDCSGLTSVTIPDSVTSIGDYAFYGCTRLTSINVDENNKNYRSDEGILFNKNMTTLIQYPSAKTNSEYVIPNSVTSIYYSAFSDCTRLISITIPNSVTSIGGSAFWYCTGLTSITIPNGITRVDGWAFWGCKNLSDVWYDGTEEEKKKINIQEMNENLLNATWHYNGTIQVNIPNYEKGGDVIVAIYNSDDMLIGINSYTSTEYINVSYGKDVAYIKVMQWETGTMKPLAPEQRIDL